MFDLIVTMLNDFTRGFVAALIFIGLLGFADMVEAAHLDNANEIHCLADNIYHEARGQIDAGQFAVAFVTLNRVNDTWFPDSVCGVVKQAKLDTKGNPIKNKCTFSWYCDGRSDKITNDKSYEKAIHIAMIVYYNRAKIYDFTKGATHYHAKRVSPYWVKQKVKTVDVGDHMFYIWRKA